MNNKAKEAMLRRSAEKSRAKTQQTMTQYYIVIGVFCATMVAIVLYTIFDPKESISQRLVVDDAQIMVHNNAMGSFERQPNTQFEVSLRHVNTARAKKLKMSSACSL